MVFASFPTAVTQINPRNWDAFAPYYTDLQQREFTPASFRQWLADWSKVRELLEEAGSLINIEKSLDTADKAKEQAFLDFINQVVPFAETADQVLRERLLGLDDAIFPMDDITLIVRNVRNDAALFRQENIPLQTRLAELDSEYDKVTGGLTAVWQGEPQNLNQLELLLHEKDRAVRESAWQIIHTLWLSVRERLNQLYAQMLPLRHQMALNAGLPDFRDYVFRQYRRFDYTAEDCLTFHAAIEAVVVPAARRIYEKRRQQLGVERLRPWDLLVDTSTAPPLKPYTDQPELIQRSLNVFHQVDSQLGRYLAIMAEEELLDLQTRPGKALGGYCSTLALRKRPFIFMNGVGIHNDVQTMLHEAGHAFHVFETAALPYIWQTDPPLEFCEVASMAMELLAAPYLTTNYGGFYTPAESAQARIENLESIITFWPYMAVVDAFQHWVYTHPEQAADAANCDATWNSLWDRFMPGVDWEGYETVRQTGWHRKLHIFSVPFYYVEYGLARVGALQVWRNSLADQATAVAAYRHALALGNTAPLPQLYQAVGAEFRFDTAMLAELVTLVESTLHELEQAAKR